MVEVEAPPAGSLGECPYFSGIKHLISLLEGRHREPVGMAKVLYSGVLRNSPAFLEWGQVIPLSHA